MNIAFVGLAGVPYLRRASDTRLIAFAHAYIKINFEVYIFNRFPVKKISEIKFDQIYDEKVHFIELINRDKPNRKLINVILKLASYPIEFLKVIRFNKNKKIDIIQVYSGHFFEFIFYYLLAKAIKAKIIYQYNEYRSAISRTGLYHKINGYLCDNYGYKCFDGIICISNFIENSVKQSSPGILLTKVPPICDFDYFDSITDRITPDLFMLFCGSSAYFEVIQTIIDSYNLSLCKKENIKLMLIINGSPKEILEIENYIKGNNTIHLISNIAYNTLIDYYKSALALLIPLRPTIQDVARFPNKICEYSAARNVIITTNCGEIPFYFTDKENALIANEYSPKAIAEKIDWLINNRNESLAIRNKAYDTGRKHFNINSYTGELNFFLKSILSN